MIQGYIGNGVHFSCILLRPLQCAVLSAWYYTNRAVVAKYIYYKWLHVRTRLNLFDLVETHTLQKNTVRICIDGIIKLP